MRLLVLDGSGLAGRAAVAEALGRGWEVTTPDRAELPVQDPLRADVARPGLHPGQERAVPGSTA